MKRKPGAREQSVRRQRAKAKRKQTQALLVYSDRASPLDLIAYARLSCSQQAEEVMEIFRKDPLRAEVIDHDECRVELLITRKKDGSRTSFYTTDRYAARRLAELVDHYAGLVRREEREQGLRSAVASLSNAKRTTVNADRDALARSIADEERTRKVYGYSKRTLARLAERGYRLTQRNLKQILSKGEPDFQ